MGVTLVVQREIIPRTTMPMPPSLQNSIQSVRTFIDSGGATGSSPFLLLRDLFKDSDQIVAEAESFDAVLALAPVIEAYRGRGSQTILTEFNQGLGSLASDLLPEPFSSSGSPELSPEGNDSAGEPPYWIERLSEYFFARVQQKPVRSQLAGRLRRDAWEALGELAGIRRRPEHLALALKTAADKRHHDEEREGAVQFLVLYWADETPDKATMNVLEGIRTNSPSRSFLVSVLQAQIDLGLSDELGALDAVDDWDEMEEDEEENDGQ